MKDVNLKPKKSLGQNFLTDKNIPDKIVRLSDINKTNDVLEIGPGLGALTVPLCDAANTVIAIELDFRLVEELKATLEAHKNVTIIQGDVLKLDIRKLIADKKHIYACANLPYNITTPVITQLIETGIFECITVMVQKEVAQRICAKPGTPEYGAFSVYTNYHTTPEILFDVPPECFNPRPKVTSSVVKMTVRKKKPLKPEDEKLFFRVVKAAFGQRRKTLANALHATFESTHSKDEIIRVIENCGFDNKIRGEKLSINDFILICNTL